MPVIIVGADTVVGRATVAAVAPTASELRVFVSDPASIDEFKAHGFKVAVGDVSDGSHVGGAALNAFCAVLIGEAAVDDRERSFAGNPHAVVAAWADGVRDAGVHRVIWVDPGDLEEAATALGDAAIEVVAVEAAGRTPEAVAADVARLEASDRL